MDMIELAEAVLGQAPVAAAVFAAVRVGDSIVNFRARYANPGFVDLLGEAVASGERHLFTEFTGLRPLLDPLARVAAGGRPVELDRSVVVQGQELHLRVSAAGFGGDVLLLAQDQSLLVEQGRALEQARAARTEFLATVSHELRTPLNTIIGFAEIMKEGLFGPIGHARYSEYIQDIFKAGRSLLGIVDDFLDHNRLQALIEQSPQGYRTLLDLAPDMVCLAHDDRIITLNSAGADMLGTWPPGRVVGQTLSQFVHPDYRDLARHDLECLVGERHRVPMKFLRADGSEIEVEVAVQHCSIEDHVDAVMLVARDISGRNRALRAALAREERLRKILAAVAEAVISVDEHGCVDSVNPAAERIFGFANDDLVGQPVAAVLPDFAAFSTAADGGPGQARETQGLHKSGHHFPVELTVNELKLTDHRLYIAVAHDITQRKDSERHLRFLAAHDPLTGLANRALFQDRLTEAIAAAGRDGHQVAVLFVDIDDFKRVNDVMGHRAGDMTLQAVARRLEACIDHGDLVARLNGDEFTMILPRVHDQMAVAAAAQRILSQLFLPFQIEGKEIYLSGSIGVAMYPSHGEDVTNVLRNVDMAVHHAKRQGGNTFKFFSADLGAEALERAALERGLRMALHDNEFLLHFQPKIDLGSGRVSGAEALLRWNSAELGPVPPDRFIPVAEETGLILPIGAWVIRSACEHLKAWEERGLPPLPVSVNLSARQFHQPDLVESIGVIVEESGIDPTLLEIELTESMLVENAEAAIMVMRALRVLGVSLSIDDFGTGYSSLAYLKRFPVDTLKIDRSFVKDLPEDKDDAAIARAIINLARSLDLKIVAEGIETVEQADFLRDNGCHLGQGYFYSRPLAADAFAEWRQRSAKA